MSQRWGKLESAFFFVFAVLFVIGIALKVSFYFVGSTAPDVAAGRTYPVQMHGIVYVDPTLGMLSDGALVAAAIAFVVMLAIWNRHWLFDVSSKRKDDA